MSQTSGVVFVATCTCIVCMMCIVDRTRSRWDVPASTRRVREPVRSRSTAAARSQRRRQVDTCRVAQMWIHPISVSPQWRHLAGYNTLLCAP